MEVRIHSLREVVACLFLLVMMQSIMMHDNVLFRMTLWLALLLRIPLSQP